MSLCVRQIIAGSLDDRPGCNRGTVILRWVGAPGKEGALNAMTVRKRERESLQGVRRRKKGR